MAKKVFLSSTSKHEVSLNPGKEICFTGGQKMNRAYTKDVNISPWLFLLPSVFGIAVTYGIGRYAYGFFLPTFIEKYSLCPTRVIFPALPQRHMP